MSVFNKVAVRKPPMSKFNLTHDKKFSTDPGRLTPVMVTDVLPGDIFKISNEALVRFAPLVAPVMHEASCSFYHFFVPNRIVWPNWEPFISPETIDTVPPAMPLISLSSEPSVSIQKGSLGDYFGLPTGVGGVEIQALPVLGYNKIFNEYFRDQNLQTELFPDSYDLVKFPNIVAALEAELAVRGIIPQINWPHDYFTAALPFAQKGQPVSIGGTTFDDVPVYSEASGVSAGPIVRDNLSGAALPDGDVTTNPVSGAFQVTDGGGTHTAYYDPAGTMFAETSSLVGNSITINDLRVAIKTQEFLERQARGGSRYTENLRMQWGVKSSDARLQRPEFIGMSHGPVQISEVLQTSESTESSPLATMSGHGISAGRTRSFRYRAEEHGFIFTLMVIRPKTAYQQGVPRMYSRKSIFDYAVPVLANIGEQEVLNKEVYFDFNDGLNDETFGYQPRYEEYRHINSSVAGDFRDTLSHWHWGRIFDERPTLSSEFMQCNPSSRIFAVTDPDIDHLWCHSKNIVTAIRKLPRFGTPML